MAPFSDMIATVVRRQAETIATCTLETCGMEMSWYEYRPSLGANAAFAAIFGVSSILYAVQGFQSKKFIAFSVAMMLGCIGETLGYIGRILMWQDPFAETPFMLQIACLTFAPSFLAAGIYFTLSRIVVTIGRENSRLPPLWYPRIFIPCDFFSLVFQAAGGGLASAADDPEGADLGRIIMVVGLVLQVATMTLFIGLTLEFALRTWRRNREMGEAALDPRYAGLRSYWPFRGFLVALALATLLIFLRCVYRVAELSEGWDGPLMHNEPLFIGLEGVVVAVAVVLLNAFNPCYCFKAGYDKEISLEMKGKKKDATDGESDGRKPEDSGSGTPMSSY